MRPPDLRGALSSVAARVAGSRFAKPAARAALLAMGLIVLAIIGRSAIAGPGALAGTAAPPPDGATLAATPAVVAPMAVPTLAAPAPREVASVVAAAPAEGPAAPGNAARSAGAASPNDPVLLNTATVEDLRRLPGVGPKRADAILALRSRLGRFRTVEDLLKVKGIGRATLRRLRPLVRLDPAPSGVAMSSRPDGGAPPVPTGPPMRG